jgi:hypothetical protein
MVAFSLWQGGVMFQENIFYVGPEVTGNSFIGRKKAVTALQVRVFNSSSSLGISIVGLTRIGKSSLVHNSIKDDAIALKGMIYVRHVLSEHNSFMDLWHEIISRIEEELINRKFEQYEYLKSHFQKALSIEPIDNNYPILRSCIHTIFSRLNRYNIHTILVLDEFDHAQKIFKGNKPYFEVLRSIATDPNYKIKTVLISRRSLHLIESCSPENSSFHNAFNRSTLTGFDSEDMKEYFEAFRRYDIFFSSEEKEKLLYYCGNLPFLLSMFGEYIVGEKIISNTIPSMDIVFEKKSPQIMDYYRDIIKLLDEDNLLEKLMGVVLGPQIGVSANDVSTLLGMGLIYTDGDYYTSVSPHFTEHIRSIKLSFPISQVIEMTEILLKEVIDIKMPAILTTKKNEWQTNFETLLSVDRTVASKLGIHNLGELKTRRQREKDTLGIDLPFIDLITLGAVLKIIEYYWDKGFSQVFGGKNYIEWKDKFSLLYFARNRVSHANVKYLSEKEVSLVNIYCDDIRKAVEKFKTEQK